MRTRTPSVPGSHPSVDPVTQLRILGQHICLGGPRTPRADNLTSSEALDSFFAAIETPLKVDFLHKTATFATVELAHQTKTAKLNQLWTCRKTIMCIFWCIMLPYYVIQIQAPFALIPTQL